MMRLVSTKRTIYILIIIFGFVLTYYAYFPGLVVNDSADQFHQGQTFQFSDWHPPVMAFIWSLTNRLIPGPEGMFLLQLMLYWGGFLIIGLVLIRNVEPCALFKFILLTFLPFSPFLINICGTIWKDVLVFGCFVMALGLILLRPENSRRFSWYAPIIIGLLIIGSLTRYNSIIGAIPLLVLYGWPKAADDHTSLRLLGRGVTAAVLTVTVVLGIGSALDKFVLHSTKAHIQNSILLFDLVGISNRINYNLVPGVWSDEESRRILGECYTPAVWSPVSPYGECHFVFDKLWESGTWQNGLLPVWMLAVKKYPRQYVMHRLDYMHTLLWPQTTFVLEPNRESFDFGFQENGIFDGIRNVMVFLRYQFPLYLVLTDGFWIALSVAASITIYLLFLSYPHAYYRSLLVALSAAFYAAPLAIVGQAGDFRYVYWTAGATCIAGLVAPWRPRLASS